MDGQHQPAPGGGTDVSGRGSNAFLLTTGQPGLLGLSDGSISTIAPVFAAALSTGSSRVALLVGLSAALGAAISMAVSEALSDDGELTGRGAPWRRGLITGTGTLLGGSVHSLPFLIAQFRMALTVAIVVVAVELVAIAWVRWRFFPSVSVGRSLVQVTVAGALVFAVGLLLGSS